MCCSASGSMRLRLPAWSPALPRCFWSTASGKFKPCGCDIATLLKLMRTKGWARGKSAGGCLETVCCSLSCDLGCARAGRFPVLRLGRQGLFHRASRRHAGRNQARARHPVLFALRRRRCRVRQRAAGGRVAVDVALWRAVRVVLLRDLRPHVAGATQTLDLAGRNRRRVLGRVRDSVVVDGGTPDRQPDRPETLNTL